MKKVFRPNLLKLQDLVDQVFNNNQYSNKELDKLFRNDKKLGARDRHFIAENIYELVRWWRKVLFAAGLHESVYVDKKKLSTDSIEKLVIAWLGARGYDITPFLDEKTSTFVRVFKNKWYEKKLPVSLSQSYSDFFWETLEEQFADGAKEMARALNVPAQIYLRTNLNRVSLSDLKRKLADEGIQTNVVDAKRGTLCLIERKNVFITPPFKEGLFEVQDWGSQHVATLLDVQPGQRVVDACAGAGGKTLHIADIMKNKGKIISLDIHAWKLQELKLRARRNRCSIVENRVIDSTKVIKRLKEQADRVLLDVPCTGSGVIRRNPDSKWKINREGMDELVALQANILENYAKMVKPDGKLVYATCSLFKQENSDQVSRFLEKNEGWTLEKEINLLPTAKDCDGFYAARLKRKCN